MKKKKSLKLAFMDIFINVYKWPIKLIYKMRPQNFDMFLSRLCLAIQPKEYHLEYKLMPKQLDKIPLYNYSDKSLEELAIIIQGPLFLKYNYTLETVKYYRKMYPESLIIVSTWKGSDKKTVEAIRAEGALVLLNDDPENPGIVNTNRQMVSTQNGIKAAKEQGKKYVAKTRSDQCLRRPHVFQTLLHLFDLFPVNGKNQNKRLIVVPTFGMGDMFYPYTFGDSFQMGDIEDMERLWDAPYDNSPIWIIKPTRRQQAAECNENIFIRNYLKNLDCDLDFSVRDSWEVYKKYFIFVDCGMLNLHYAKEDIAHFYTKSVNMIESEFYLHDNDWIVKSETFGFVNWLNLYYGSLKYSEKLEKYADSPLP